MPEPGSSLPGALTPRVAPRHQPTIEVLSWVLRAGRQLDVWLADILSEAELDTTEFIAVSALGFSDSSNRLSAGQLADAIVQTSGGTAKTIRRLADRGLVRRVSDPDDGRRTLLELTDVGRRIADETLDLVLDAFELDIGDLDEAERSELGSRLARLSVELSDRLRLR